MLYSTPDGLEELIVEDVAKVEIGERRQRLAWKLAVECVLKVLDLWESKPVRCSNRCSRLKKLVKTDYDLEALLS